MNKKNIFETITGHTCEVLPQLSTHSFQPDDVLKDLGANSIDRSEIIMMTLASLSLKIPLIELAKASNIGELSEIMYDKFQTV